MAPQALEQQNTAPQPMIEVVNPASGRRIGEVVEMDSAMARRAVEQAKSAQRRWGATPLPERVALLRRFRDLLLERADEVARLLSLENGKVLQESLQMELFPLVDLTTYFTDRAQAILAPRPLKLHLLKHRRSVLACKPRGVVLVISPWNYPLSIPLGETVMALLAGNAVVIKPAPQTPLIAVKARELLQSSGLDPRLVQVVTAGGQVASEMIGMGVDYVNFTGSTAVGRKVAAACGQQLVPCTLELGGKDPAIVLPDADVERAAASLVWGAFANAGQTCASVERVYAHRDVYDRLVRAVVGRTERLRQGDPLEDGVDVGPMTVEAQLRLVEGHVGDAVARGARVLTGGAPLSRQGQFFPPTVLVNVDDSMQIMREETFGPVLPIMRVDTVEEAIRRANDSPYGLNAYVYGRDRQRARQVASRLEAGTVMVNETMITHACPETPWGGVKLSGVGRVHSDDGLRELCQTVHTNEEAVGGLRWSPFWQPYSHAMYRTVLGAARMLQHSSWRVRLQGAGELVRGVQHTWRQRRGA